MSIAFLVPSVSRNGGGVFEAVRRMAAELSAPHAASLRVIGLEDSATALDLPAWTGVRVTTAAVVGPRMFGYAPQLLSMIEAAQPDLLHQHGLWTYSSIVCRRWSSRTGRPYIVSPHGMLDGWALLNSGWKKRLAAVLYESGNLERAVCLHALCEAEARAIRAYGLKNPVCVIPNGIDPPPEGGASPAWDDDPARGAKILLYLGRLHPKKNLLNLLDAWAATQSGGARGEWRLVIAGWAQNGYGAELQRAAHDLGIEASVRFAGAQFGKAKHATLRRANAFILPSLSEGLPIAVLEAWAYGLPVVMTPECNLPEGFQASAAIESHASAPSLAAAMTNLFSLGNVERAAMGERGRRLVQERYSWPKIAEMMMQVYGWSLGGGPKPDCVLDR